MSDAFRRFQWPFPMDLPSELWPKPESVHPDLIAYARARGVATDTAQSPPYIDDLEFSSDDGFDVKAMYQQRLEIFRHIVKPNKLEMEEGVKRELAMNALDELQHAEPHWKTIFPQIPLYNVHENPPYLLTYEGELTGKVLLAKKSHGAEFASKLKPEDSPVEIEFHHMSQTFQAMPDPSMKKASSAKLECSKESLALAAESQRVVQPGKAVDAVLGTILPKLKGHSTEFDDTLRPIDELATRGKFQKAQNGDSVSTPKRKHTESRDLSPVKTSLQPARRLSTSRSVSVAASDRVSISHFPAGSTPPKKLKTSKSMPHFSQTSDAINLNSLSLPVLPLPVPPASKSGSNQKECPSLASSMNLPESPNAIPASALVSVTGAFGGLFVDSASSKVPLIQDSMPDPSNKDLTSCELKHRELLPYSLRPSQFGSVLRFMETRGKSQIEDPRVEQSPKSLDSEEPCDKTEAEKAPCPSAVPLDLPLDLKFSQLAGLLATGNSQSDDPIPDFPTPHPVLFVSTMLLKTHLSLIKSFQSLPSPPTLIFRDYVPEINNLGDDHVIPGRLSMGPSGRPLQLPDEADLIVAPNTGVILTNIQALTQVYLPGHAQKLPRTLAAGEDPGPVQRRMMTLSPRYQHLYLLVCDSGTNKVDKPTKKAIQTLSARSVDLSNVTSLYVKSPDDVAKTILSLSHKHTLDVVSRKPRAKSGSRIMAPSSIKQATPPIHLLITDPETRWELFLRCLGLNPFAARLVLGILEAREQNEIADSKAPAENKNSALCTFMGMEMEEMTQEFGHLLGTGVINIVQKVLIAWSPLASGN